MGARRELRRVFHNSELSMNLTRDFPQVVLRVEDVTALGLVGEVVLSEEI